MFFFPHTGAGAHTALGNKGLAFSPAWVRALCGGRALLMGGRSPQGTALPGCG